MKRANLAAGPSSISDDDDCDVEFYGKTQRKSITTMNIDVKGKFNSTNKKNQLKIRNEICEMRTVSITSRHQKQQQQQEQQN